MKYLFPFVFALILGCSKPPDAEETVANAIDFSGVKKLENAEISFSFRGTDYVYQKRNGVYRYSRSLKDSLGNDVQDVLTNTGFNRFVNGKLILLEEEKKETLSASLNSVIYFAFLPFPLADDAVNSTYVDKVSIKDQKYHKIKVTFDEDGGGEDYEDVFIYWLAFDDYSLDYLAYSYNEKDGKGLRFRQAYNPRRVNGILIQDYRNFKPRDEVELSLTNIDQAFTAGDLTLLSVIELKQVSF
ncbi:MAG: DUF6503 family protein [Bacteroidota bacterium]